MGDGRPYTKRQILHHAPHSAHPTHRLLRPLSPRRKQILNAAIRVNLHRTEVVKPVHQPRILAELLVERVAEVVGRVRGY